MTTLQQVTDAVKAYFGDTTRDPQETKNGLYEIADLAETSADSIPDEPTDDEGGAE